MILLLLENGASAKIIQQYKSKTKSNISDPINAVLSSKRQVSLIALNALFGMDSNHVAYGFRNRRSVRECWYRG